MRNLTLNVKKKWFDMILSGDKKEEYRELKDFSVVRCLQMDSELVYDGCGNKYKKTELMNAYAFSKGLTGKRLGAVKYLLGICASFKEYDTVTFLNGMKALTPTIVIECKGIIIGGAVPEWSDNMQGEMFVIKLGKLISTKNINNNAPTYL